jgi:TonB family protein
MKMAAMLSVFLFICLPGTRFGCVALQQEAVKSLELEEAARLSGQVLALFTEKKFEEALGLAKQALEIREKVLGQDHESVASSLDSIADIYVAQEKYGAAEPLYRRSLAILEKKWGPESKNLTSTIESLALVRFALRDNGGAEKLYSRSLAIKEKALGPDDPGTGRILETMGVFYERIEKPARAAEFFKRSLAVKEKELGPNHPDLIETLFNCACAYVAANKASDAKPYQLRAASIEESLPSIKRGFVLQGSAILKVDPEYPPEARRARVSGKVVVEVTVDECGRVIAARALSGHVDLVEGAIKAARQWRFTRTKLGGRPVKVIGTITFNFNI